MTREEYEAGRPERYRRIREALARLREQNARTRASVEAAKVAARRLAAQR